MYSLLCVATEICVLLPSHWLCFDRITLSAWNKQKKKRRRKASSSLCRLALCWATPSMPCQAVHNLALAFKFCLHRICRQAKCESFGSSWAFSAHVSCPVCVHGLLDSLVHMGAFTVPICAGISFPSLFLFLALSLFLVLSVASFSKLLYLTPLPLNAFSKSCPGSGPSPENALSRMKQRETFV